MRLIEWKEEKKVTAQWIIDQARARGVDFNNSRMHYLLKCETMPLQHEFNVLRNITSRKAYRTGEDFYPPIEGNEA